MVGRERERESTTQCKRVIHIYLYFFIVLMQLAAIELKNSLDIDSNFVSAVNAYLASS